MGEEAKAEIIRLFFSAVIAFLIFGVVVYASVAGIEGEAKNTRPQIIPGSLAAHEPIYINGDSEFTEENGVTSGNGTETEPYVIEGWDISAASAPGIAIMNTGKYFVIRNCRVHDGGTAREGIVLFSLENGAVCDTVSYNNNIGIRLYQASNNYIKNCTTYSNEYQGILFGASSNHNRVINCSIHNNSYGISNSLSSGNKVHYCDIFNNFYYGIQNQNSEAEFQVNATYNWWGDGKGPESTGSTGDKVTAGVLYEPWLDAPLRETLEIIAPCNNSWVNTKAPTFEWSFIDQIAFQIQVGTDDNWANGAESWDNTSETAEQYVTYSGDALVDTLNGRDYIYHYWRLRCKDVNGLWSSWTETYNFRIDVTAPGSWANPKIEGHGYNCWEEQKQVVNASLGCADYGSGLNCSIIKVWYATDFKQGVGCTWILWSNTSWKGGGQSAVIYAWSVPFNMDSEKTNGEPLVIKIGLEDNVGNFGYFWWKVKIDAINHNLLGTLGTNDWYISNVTVNFTYPLSMGESNYNYTNYTINEGAWQTGNFTLSADGIYDIQYYAVSKSGTKGVTKKAAVKIDKTSPVTDYTFSGSLGTNGWYTSPVNIDLQASDATSGINYTSYKINSGSWQTGSTTTISADGVHTIYYYSIDNASNQEAEKSITLKIDKTTPSTTYSLSGNNGIAEWFRSQVQVTLSPSDETSGVNYTKYKINDGYWQTGTGFTLTDEGTYTIYYYTADLAGNAETEKNFTIGIDKTVPEVYSIDINSGATYTNSTNVQLSLSAYDLLSGLWQSQFSNDGSLWSEWQDWSENITWNLASGADGERKVFFRVKDKAGNQAPAGYDTIILDQTAPTTTHSISGTAGANGWYISNVAVSLTASDATSGVNKTYYKAALSDWQEGTSLSLTQEGTHTVYYYSTDIAGNQEPEKNFAIKIDKTAPSTSHSASGTLGSNGWHTSDVTINLTSNDAVSGLNYTKYRINSGPWQSYTANFTLTAEGTHVIEFYSADKAGNVEDAGSISFKIDKTAPVVTISLSPSTPNGENGWYTMNITITVEVADDMSGVNTSTIEYNLDSAGWTAYPGQIKVSDEGPHTIEGRAIDYAGLAGAATPASFNLDKIKPETNASLDPAAPDGGNGWYVSDIMLNLTANDGVSGIAEIKYRTNNGIWRAYTDNITITQEGENNIEFYSVDVAGNAEATKSITIKLDKTVPSTTKIVTPAAPDGSNEWYISDITVSLAGNDITSGVDATKYRINGGAWIDYESALAFSVDGSYTVEYYSTDKAGNIESTHSLSLKLDKTKPITAATLIPPFPNGQNDWYISNITLVLSASDAMSGIAIIKYRVNGEPWSDYISTLIFSADGTYAVEYYAADNASNAEDVKSISFKVDKTKPTSAHAVTPSAPDGNNNWYVSNISISLSSTDDTSGLSVINYRINAGSWLNYSAALSFTEDGAYTVEYYSIDDAGNQEAAKSITVRLDKTEPTTSSSISGMLGNNSWYISNVTITLSGDDAISGVNATRYRVNSGEWCNYCSDLTFSAEGAYTLEHYSTDLAGNVETVNVVTFRLDKTPPTTVHTVSGTLGNNSWYVSNVSLSLTSEDSTSGVNIIEYRIDGGEWLAYSDNILIVREGIHTLDFYSEDLAGNVEIINSITIKLDKIAPSTNHSVSGTHGSSGWYISPVAVALNGTDSTSGVAYTYYQINGGATQTGTNVMLTKSGTYTVKYWSEDNAGNAEEDTSVIIKIDLDMPTATLISPQNGEIIDNDAVQLTWNGSDDTSGIGYYEVQVDNNYEFGSPEFTNVTTETSTTTASLPDNAYYWRVRAVDLAGNTGSWDTRTFTVDTGPPANLTIKINGGAVFTNTTLVTLTLSSAENAYEMCFSNDNTTWSDWECFASTKEWTLASGEGEKTVYFKCRNAFGSESEVVSDVIILDTISPTTSDDAPSGWQRSKTITVNLIPVDDTSGVAHTYYKLWRIAEAEPEWTEGIAVTISADGKWKVEYYSVDNAGNKEASKTAEVWVDTEAPATADDAPSGWQTVKPINITLTSTDATSGVAYTNYKLWLNTSSEPAGWTAGNVVEITGEGEWHLKYYSVDAAGNAEAAVAVEIWIDTISPTTQDDAPVGWQIALFNITLTATDATSGVKATYYKLWTNGTPEPDSWSTGTCIRIISDGIWNIKYYSRDFAENAENITVRQAYLDTVAPTTTDDAPAGWVNTTVTVTLTPNDVTSGVAHTYCKLWLATEDEPSSYTEGAPILITSDGKWYIKYYSIDNAGNKEASVQKEVWIDTLQPSLEITKPQNGTITNKENITIEGTVSDLNGIENAEMIVNDIVYNIVLIDDKFSQLVSISSGTNIITLGAKDLARNWAEISIMVTYDPTIPCLIIYSPLNNSITNNSHCLVSGKTEPDYTLTVNGIAVKLSEGGEFEKTITLNEGLNIINVTSENLAGTKTSALVYVTLDTTAPAPPKNITVTPAHWTNINEFTINWTNPCDATGIGGAWYKIGAQPGSDADGIFAAEKPFEVQAPAEGSWVVYVWLQDSAGNANHQNFSSAIIKYDCTPPTDEHALEGAEGENDWYLSQVTITLAPKDTLSGVKQVKYRINNSSWLIYDEEIILSDGIYEIEYFGVDNAGNTGLGSVFSVKIDSTAPEKPVLEALPQYVNKSSITLNWSQSFDSGSGLKGYRVEFNTHSTEWLNTTTYTLELEEGVLYSIRIIVSDNAGNSAFSSFIATISDTTPPVTDISVISGYPAQENLFGSEVKVSFWHNDTSGVKETRYRINGAEWRIYAQEFILATEGEWVIQYYSIDFAGNPEQVKTTKLVIDRKIFMPEVKILFPADGVEISQNISCRYRASSPLNQTLSIKVRLINHAEEIIAWELNENTGSFLFSPTSFLNGEYLLEVTAVDCDGRASKACVNISIKNRLILALSLPPNIILNQSVPVTATICNYLQAQDSFILELYLDDRYAGCNQTALLQPFQKDSVSLSYIVAQASMHKISVKLFTEDKELLEERELSFEVLSPKPKSQPESRAFNYLVLSLPLLILASLGALCYNQLSKRKRGKAQRPVPQEHAHYENPFEASEQVKRLLAEWKNRDKEV